MHRKVFKKEEFCIIMRIFRKRVEHSPVRNSSATSVFFLNILQVLELLKSFSLISLEKNFSEYLVQLQINEK